MINAIQAAGFSDPSPTDPAVKAPPAQPDRAPRRPAPEPPAEAHVRLTIDAAADGPYFVYTLQDRATGRILAQLPRHEVQAIADRPAYAAGDLIKTEV